MRTEKIKKGKTKHLSKSSQGGLAFLGTYQKKQVQKSSMFLGCGLDALTLTLNPNPLLLLKVHLPTNSFIVEHYACLLDSVEK